MSRSTKTVSNPVEFTLKFKNEKFSRKTKEIEQEAGFYYYKKPTEEGQEGENILIPFPLTFIWIEDAQSVSGYNKKLNKGVYSNEILSNPANSIVKKHGKKKLTVKIDGETVAEGDWKDIKADVAELGGKFCVPVYALVDVDGEWKLARILMAGGASRSAWFDLSKDRKKVENNFIIASGYEEVEMSTGDIYQKPILKFGGEVPEDLLENEVKIATKKVDEYFNFILSPEIEQEEELEADYN